MTDPRMRSSGKVKTVLIITVIAAATMNPASPAWAARHARPAGGAVTVCGSAPGRRTCHRPEAGHHHLELGRKVG